MMIENQMLYLAMLLLYNIACWQTNFSFANDVKRESFYFALTFVNGEVLSCTLVLTVPYLIEQEYIYAHTHREVGGGGRRKGELYKLITIRKKKIFNECLQVNAWYLNPKTEIQLTVNDCTHTHSLNMMMLFESH